MSDPFRIVIEHQEDVIIEPESPEPDPADGVALLLVKNLDTNESAVLNVDETVALEREVAKASVERRLSLTAIDVAEEDEEDEIEELPEDLKVAFPGGKLGLELETCQKWGNACDNCTAIKKLSARTAVLSDKLKVGDIIVAINNNSVEGLLFKQVMRKLKEAHRPLTISFRSPEIQNRISEMRRIMMSGKDGQFDVAFGPGPLGLALEVLETNVPHSGAIVCTVVVSKVEHGSQAATACAGPMMYFDENRNQDGTLLSEMGSSDIYKPFIVQSEAATILPGDVLIAVDSDPVEGREPHIMQILQSISDRPKLLSFLNPKLRGKKEQVRKRGVQEPSVVPLLPR
jgi:hypothetical protein